VAYAAFARLSVPGEDAGAGRWQRIVTGEEELAPPEANPTPDVDEASEAGNAPPAADVDPFAAPSPDAPDDRDEPQTSMALEDEAVGRDGRPESPESADGAREELPERASEELPTADAQTETEDGPDTPDIDVSPEDEAPAEGFAVADRVDRDREAAARQRPAWADPVDAGIEGLREEARRMARDDAEVDVPALAGDVTPPLPAL
jgi:hypothetical protein